MKLSDILKKVAVLESQGDLNREITGVNIDSRQVESDDLFVAVKGTQTDGHAYIDKAIGQGAKAVLMSDPLPAEPVAAPPAVSSRAPSHCALGATYVNMACASTVGLRAPPACA